MAAKAVSPLYLLYGKKGIAEDTMPPLEQPIGDTVVYHVRRGGHDVTAFDWEQYFNFADRQVKRSARGLH